ncbi:MAG: ClpXP protease specificity-enhancing factor [Candidatus Obscuribacterales bacterium]|nr:ClpXP protease specificity-enhancing factor [Steroidobacteraceae bacterium]
MSNNETAAISRRPYLLRAMHEWITDNQQTPHIVVDATLAGVAVPQQFVQSGKIILNVSHSATNGLALGNDAVRFRARFGSVTHDVNVPVLAILGIYARETGQGMIFSENDAPTTPPTTEPPTNTPTGPSDAPPKRSHLKVVK